MQFLMQKVTSKYLLFVQNVEALVVKANLFFYWIDQKNQ